MGLLHIAKSSSQGERSTGQNVNVVRSDNANEFLDMKKNLEEKGKILTRSTPYCLQSIELVKQMDNTSITSSEQCLKVQACLGCIGEKPLTTLPHFIIEQNPVQ